MSKTAKAAKLSQDRRAFERENLYRSGRSNKGATIGDLKRQGEVRGADVVRVSPQTISRNGLKYRKVYMGQVVVKNYFGQTRSRGIDGQKKFTDIEWRETGVVRASVKSGSRSLLNASEERYYSRYNVQSGMGINHLKSAMMIRKRRTSKR